MLIPAVRAFVRRVSEGLSDEQRQSLQQRDAERLGISRENWSQLRATNMDLVGLREAHRIVVGRQSTVRRTDRDGSWTSASAHPGHLRSQPQSFRAGLHIEPAWDLTTLKQRMARVLADVTSRFDAAPIPCAAELVWAISRAQPFIGRNARLSLLVSSRLLSAAGLPVLPILQLERDAELEACIVAATEDNRAELEIYLANTISREALAIAEWISIAPNGRWSLRDEHAALSALRSTTPVIECDPFIAEAARALVALCESAVGTNLTPLSGTSRHHLRIARDATYRGCPICSHMPIREFRWSIDNLLELVVVIGTAGRGITGASSLHISIEVGGVVNALPAAAFLLVPDEDVREQQARFSAWAPSAIRHAVRTSALRC